MSEEKDPFRDLEEELRALARGGAEQAERANRALEKLEALRANSTATPAANARTSPPEEGDEPPDSPTEFRSVMDERIAIVSRLDQPFSLAQAIEALGEARRTVQRFVLAAVGMRRLDKVDYGWYRVIDDTSE